MRTLDHPSRGAVLKPPFLRYGIAKRFKGIGIVFIVIGAIAILVPAWATLAGELLIAWMLSLWGAAGLWFAWEMRAAQEGRYAAVAFGATFLLGLLFLLYPSVGVEALTVVMMAAVLGVSFWWWSRLDEAAREAHKWAWYWGGSSGMLIGLVLMLVLKTRPADIALPASLGQTPADLLLNGMMAILLFQLVGYGLAWAWWWLGRR